MQAVSGQLCNDGASFDRSIANDSIGPRTSITVDGRPPGVGPASMIRSSASPRLC